MIKHLKKTKMTQIGAVPAIKEVKRQLDQLKEEGYVSQWELPYESILTRLTAAIFFLSPVKEDNLGVIWQRLGENEMLSYKPNEDKKLSGLDWRVEFNKGFEL